MRKTLFLVISVVALAALVTAGAGSAELRAPKSHRAKSQDVICSDFSNTIGYDCRQSDNHPYLGSGNTAGHSVDACNSSNQ